MRPRTAVALGAFALELGLVPLIIWKVPYTEIDWKAYMQEVEAVLNGELNYMNIRGDTGPIVYPAGFVYVYSLLYAVTSRGLNILLAQKIFGAIYLAFIATVLYIYTHLKDGPAWPLLLLCLSRRIHSIFLLRLFNDGVAMLFLYAAIALFLHDRWTIGCVLYSLAVGVKMNVLLFAPGLLILLLQRFGPRGTALRLGVCALVQLLLGLPFLATFPLQYLSRAFELNRVFLHTWTVNLKFLPEDVFQSKQLALGLLGAHLGVLLVFAHRRWCRPDGGLPALVLQRTMPRKLTPTEILGTLFESNFIGIVFARTLHFQFYVWYYHTLIYLLWVGCRSLDGAASWVQRLLVDSPLAKAAGWAASDGVRVAVLVGVEVVWNVFPSRPATAMVLTALHCLILALLAASHTAGPIEVPKPPPRPIAVPRPVPHRRKDRED